ncbi:MAG: hypothetical protein IPJ81_19510 [Chitinophagaceae bacterium]|nr:hypothetical protein [Chitinophagaceae bacterium]
MKKFLKYFIIIIILVGIGGYIFWQQYKKRFIKDTISDSIIKNTDSLYTINYDSSSIDEINGNASFYDLQIQPDSAIKELFKSRNDLPNALYNIKVKEIQVVGVDVAGLVKKENLTTKKIVLNQPSIQITNTGADKPKEFTYKDTLQLYQQILGKFKNINAGAIQIINGSVLITDNKGKSLTTLENINVELKNFLVDSTRNYQNVISYFIKDVKITVENIQLPESKNDTRINMVGIEYDAAKRILYVKEIQQYKSDAIQPLTDLKNIQINQLNTDAFILYHELKAGMITCDGGLVTIYKNTKQDKTKKNNNIIQFSSNIIDEAKIEGVKLGNTKVIISNPLRPGDEPFIINDVKFTATKVASVTEASTVAQMINTADWELSAGNFSLVTKDKLYKIIANNILINNLKSYVEVKNINIKPLLTEAAFVRKSRHQRDRFDLSFNNIILRQVNFKKLIIDNSLEIENASLQPVMKIFNDRTLPPDPNSKVGKYPHQLLLKMGLPIYIKTLQVKDGSIAYKEKAVKSRLTGNVFFTHLNATINNLTNINQKYNLMHFVI